MSPQPPPNDHNTGSELKHLTDGGLAGAEGRMWSDKRAMGWAYQPYARLTFDLEKSQPVGQVVMRLQVISQTSTLPGKITVSLSDDGERVSRVDEVVGYQAFAFASVSAGAAVGADGARS